MKIERIDDNKIKVEINSEDVKHWNVNIKKLSDNTPEAQNLFWYAVKQAEKQLDFSVGTSKLLVEAIPLENDGFIMIITKIGLSGIAEMAASIKEINFKNAEIKIKKLSPKIKRESCAVYKFASFDDLCTAAGEIYPLFIGSSRVYKHRDEFYIKLKPSDVFGFYEIDNKLSEFSSRCVRPELVAGYLEEHGETLIGFDAVEALQFYFSD